MNQKLAATFQCYTYCYEALCPLGGSIGAQMLFNGLQVEKEDSVLNSSSIWM